MYWWTQVMVVQWKKKLSPIGSELLCWIEGEQGLACVPVLACKSFNLSTKAVENTLGVGCCSGRFCVLSVLVSCKLKESNVAMEISKGVVCLSISKTELEIWDAREAPGGLIFGRKLGGVRILPIHHSFTPIYDLSTSLNCIIMLKPMHNDL